MALQAFLPYLPAVISSIGSLLQGEQDPNKDIRERMNQLIARIEKEFPRAASAARIRESVQRGALERSIADRGAAGGLPRNVVQQNITEAGLGSRRNLDEYLENLRNQKLNAMMGVGGLVSATPQQPVNTGWQDLFGISLYDLLSSGKLEQMLPLISDMGNTNFQNLAGTYNQNQLLPRTTLPRMGG